MSISPPSDIVLDVARAADPTRYDAAAGRLQQMARAASAGTGFADMLTAYQADETAFAGDADLFALDDVASRAVAAPPPPGADEPGATGAKDTYGAFEAMVLANFVEAMMPKDNAVFGSGTAGEVWASMLAENIAAEIARRGGVGIADQLRTADGASTSGQSIAALDRDAVPDSAAIVDAVAANGERGFLAALGPDAPGRAGAEA